MANIDLKKYEDLYDSFDGGHNRQHLIAVRNCALDLAKKYAPNKVNLVYIAATLHDIGLSVNREEHEIEGEKLIRTDSYLKSQLPPEDFEELCHAVREHRASTGKPITIVAKIVSDADRGGGSDNPGEQFSPGSYGRRTYFPETEIRLNKIISPIIEAYQNHNIEFLRNLIKV